MPIIYEGDAKFTEEEEPFLLFLTSDRFPWFQSLATPNFPCLSHVLLKRTDTKDPGIAWSEHAGAAEYVFRRICRDNNITLRTIYRMAANLTFADPSAHGDPHNDHADFDHKIMIIYLNDFDAGETWLFDNSGNVIEKSKPARDKFIVFDGGMHANGFCKPQQRRIVLVATFDGDVPDQNKEAA